MDTGRLLVFCICVLSRFPVGCQMVLPSWSPVEADSLTAASFHLSGTKTCKDMHQPWLEDEHTPNELNGESRRAFLYLSLSRCCPNRKRRGSPSRWSKASALIPVCCKTQSISDANVISKLPGSSEQMTRLTCEAKKRCTGWCFASGTPPIRRFEVGQHSMTMPQAAKQSNTNCCRLRISSRRAGE
jgi:hypothetical protein